ncbi:MAG: alginate export family protein, partial [Planctomycetia bacterium]
GAMQLGARDDQDVVAGMATTGVGYNFKDAPMNPSVWLYYDYASGDDAPNLGSFNTFNHLFPFGHFYLGWTDLVGRQNIHDLNVQATLYPTKWITFYTAYHRFHLDEARDALYNPAGAAYRRDPTGAAGTDVGSEMDFIFNFHLTKHTDILAGYSHLWGGEFLDKTPGAQDASVGFVQFNYRW